MKSISHFVGLDVHKDTISIAVAKEGRDPAESLGIVRSDHVQLLKRLDKISPRDQLACCYEAGPTGFALLRKLRNAGVQCEVIAPSLVPHRQGDRVKTDKRDARKLAQYLRSGDLTPVWVPDDRTEAFRDLVRARDDAKVAERAARHRLSKFLLRHDRVYQGRTAWTGMHYEWLRPQKFEHEPQNRAFTEYLHAVEDASQAVARFDADTAELVVGSSVEPLVRALQALKGVCLLTAAGLAVELGDLRRFPSARELMSYVGFAVAEDSTGKRRRQFSITKAGNRHARRLLVEAAWSYRHPPKLSRELQKRSEGLAPEILEIAWKAQNRLHRRYRRLCARGKPKNVVVIAIARELAGFVWAIGQLVPLGCA